MKKMTISKKLTVLSAFMFAVTMVVGLVGYLNLDKVRTQYTTVLSENMPKQRMVLEMFLHFGMTRIQLRTLGLSGLSLQGGSEAIRLAEAEISAHEKVNGAFKQLALLPGEQKLYENLNLAWGEFKKVGENVIRAYQSTAAQDKTNLLKLILEDCPRAASKYKDAADALVNFHNQIAEARADEAQASAVAATNQTILIILSGLVFGLVFAFFISRTINRGLMGITQQLGDARTSVKSTSESLASVSLQMATSSQQQAASIEEVSASVEEIAGMVSSTVQVSENVSHLVKSGGESMAELQAAVRQISESNARVEQLAKLIEDIGEKTELIDEIVFQTRLLSFNASVEAERAGEHGRGFAVVAQEVGSLAQMSGKSATEISQIVKSGIKTAQEVAQLNRSRVELGEAAAGEAAQKLEAIQKATQEILRASQEQNSGIQQINQSIQTISVATQENASSSEECSASSQSLIGQMTSLSELVADLEAMVTGGRSFVGARAQQNGVQGERVGTLIPFKAKVSATSLSRKKVPTGLRSVVGDSASVESEDPWDKI